MDDAFLYLLRVKISRIIINSHEFLFIHAFGVLLHATILKPTANWSPDISTLVQKVKHRVYKIHVFLSESIPCRDSASYFIKN